MPRAVFVLLAAFSATALTQTPQFRSGVDLVHLDVSVLDKNRAPVRGLTAADFTILEDGQPRPVAAFVAVDVPPPPPPPPPGSWMQTVPLDVQGNEIARTPEGRLVVLLLDDVMIPMDPAFISATRKIGQLAIDRLSRGDRMAVVFTANSRGAQNFTADRAKLTEAINTFSPGHATHMLGWDAATFNVEKGVWEAGVDADAGYRAGSIRTLEEVARSLAAAPERRKILIYVSTGVYADAESASTVQLIGPGSVGPVMRRDANKALVSRLPAMYRLMREMNVTMYTIDPAGLGGMDNYLARTAQSYAPLAQAKIGISMVDDWFNMPGPPQAADLAKRVSTVSLDFLKSAASNAGGFAITDVNEFEAGITHLFAENASYYILGFALPPTAKPGSAHRLEVKVKRQDAQVRTRSGYEAPEQPAPAQATAPDAAGEPKPPPAALIAAPVPKGDLPMRLALAPLTTGTDDNRDVAVMLWLDGIPGTASQSFDVDLRAFTTEGKGKRSERRTGQTNESSTGNSTFELLARIALPPGRYEIRVGARLSPANLEGSVFSDVVVPEIPKNGLMLSGVLVDAVPAARGGPLDVFKGVLPWPPTSRREFVRGTAVRTLVRVRQAGTSTLVPVSIGVSIQDKKGEAIYNYPHRLAATRFDSASRSADFEFEIPFQALDSGEHLLTFDARAGDQRAKQQLRFTVR